MKRMFVILSAIIIFTITIAGCGNPQDKHGTNVNKTQEAASTQERELSAVDILRAHLIENGEKTKDDHRLTLQTDNKMVTFTIKTDENRAVGANNEVEQGTEGICLQSSIIADGVEHTHEIAIYEGREKYLMNYVVYSEGSYFAHGLMSPDKYPSGDWYKMTSASKKVEELMPEMVSSSTPILLAGVNKIFEDNGIPLDVSDFNINPE